MPFSRFFLALAITSALASSACGPRRRPTAFPLSTTKVRMQNPLRGGGHVTEVVVVVPSSEEHVYALPSGSLSQQGHVESLDAEKACFVVTLRQMSPRTKFADVEPWKVAMVVDDAERVTAYTKSRLEGDTRQADGRSVNTERVGYAFQCSHRDSTGNCDQQALVQQRAEVARDAKIDLAAITTRLCFETHGAVSASSRAVALEFQAPADYDAPEGFRMKWEFDD